MEERKFTDQELVRRQKLQELKDLGIDPFGQRFDVTAYTSDIRKNYSGKTAEELEESKPAVSIAGRIVAKRRKGKVCFMNLLDRDGKIQLYIKKDTVGEDVYELVKKSDLGDIIGIDGEVFMTHTGELTVRVEKYTHLTKALRPLPEKFHGLTDTEERFRRRYVDLIMNDEADDKGNTEVETPIMNSILGGAAAKPFITHFNALDKDFYLRIATELNLKRLIVGGMDAVYEIGRLFRNEGMDRTHNPEFTTIEVYKAFSDLEGMMDLTEGIIANAAMTVNGTYDVEYKGHSISLAISPLAKKNLQDPRFTQRFELFICGNEYANAFTELNDPDDQYERFANQLKEKELGNDEANEMDMDYVEALEYGLPPTGGMGMGIDRLVMLLTGQETIREVILFPHMKNK